MPTLKIEWDCVDGHHNIDTIDGVPLIASEISRWTQPYFDGIDAELFPCAFCDNFGTDNGPTITSEDPYIKGVLDTLDYLEHGD